MSELDRLKDGIKTAASQIDFLKKRIDKFGAEIKKLEEEKKIDFSKIPVDTLVEVRDRDSSDGYKNYFKGLSGGEYSYSCYMDGKTSLREAFDSWRQIRLIDNPPQPWFGGECPLPDGVRIKVWYRGALLDPTIGLVSEFQTWDYIRSARLEKYGIIAFQILKSDWQ